MKLALILLLFGGREYFPVSVSDLANGRNFHTHIQVIGKVALIKYEPDGDTHIKLVDHNGRFIVAECLPELPCSAVPKVGDIIWVRGISRFDKEHRWYEVHPVESLGILP